MNDLNKYKFGHSNTHAAIKHLDRINTMLAFYLSKALDHKKLIPRMRY